MPIARLLLVLLLFSAIARADDGAVRRGLVTAARMPAAPTVDGVVDRAEWLHAAQALPLMDMRAGGMTPDASVYWIGWTDDAIHIAFRFNRPSYAGDLKAQDDPDHVWRDDCIEVFFKPPGVRFEYNFVVNPLGIGGEGKRDGTTDRGWNAEWDCAARVTASAWEGEMRIPLATFDNPPKAGDRWQFLLAHNRKTPDNELGVSSWLNEWKDMDNFTLLRFGAASEPAVRTIEAGPLSTQEAGIVVELVGADSVKPQVELSLMKLPQGAAVTEQVQTDEGDLMIPVLVELNFFQVMQRSGADAAIGMYETVKQLSDTATQSTQRFPLVAPSPPARYLVGYTVRDGDTLLATGYLPFEQKPAFEVATEVHLLTSGGLAVVADYPRMAGVTGGDTITATLLDETGQTQLSQVAAPVDLTARRTELLLPAPDAFGKTVTVRTVLQSAAGETRADVSNVQTLPDKPIWFGNMIGITDDVLPPWTPIAVDGDHADVVLRRYTLGDNALPAQIRSRDRDLLVEPIELTLGGKTLNWQRRTVSAAPAKAVWEATANTDNVDLSLRATLEFDGMFRYDLTLTPRGKADVRNLELHIPYREDIAMVGREAEYGDFTPWHEIGDFETGLYWFCEWAKGWQIGEQPAMSVAPRGERIDWVVRFIGNEGKTLDAPLTLTFGMQGLPVKELDLSYQYDRRRAYFTPAPPDPDLSGMTSLRYPIDGNVDARQGAIACHIMKSINGVQRLIQFGEGDNAIGVYAIRHYITRYDPQLYLVQGQLDVDSRPRTGKKLTSAGPLIMDDGWLPIGLNWQRNGDTVRIGLFSREANGTSIAASADVSWEDWQRAVTSGPLRFGGAGTIAVDEIAVSRTFVAGPQIATWFDQLPTSGAGIADSLDETRLYRGLIRTRAGGLAGGSVDGSLVKKIDGKRGRALMLPTATDRQAVFDAYNLSIAFPSFEQYHSLNGYYGRWFAKHPIWRDDVRDWNQRGIDVMHYGGFGVHPEHDPLTRGHINDMVRKPIQYTYTAMLPSLNTPAQDYFVWCWKQNADYYGINAWHMDNTWHVRECFNRYIGNGWYDDDGNLRGRYPIFGARETAKRSRWVTTVYSKGGFNSLHAGARTCYPVSSMADIVQTGEGWMMGEAFELVMPEDFGRGNQWRTGIPTEILHKGSDFKFGINYLMNYTLLFDMSIRFWNRHFHPRYWHPDLEAETPYRSRKMGEFNPYFVKMGVEEVSSPNALWWQLKDDFGARSATFTPFWREPVSLNHEKLCSSIWHHQGRAVLMVVVNFSNESVNARAALDLNTLGLEGQPLVAYDAWLGDAYNLSGGEVSLTIPAGEYRLIRVEAP